MICISNDPTNETTDEHILLVASYSCYVSFELDVSLRIGCMTPLVVFQNPESSFPLFSQDLSQVVGDFCVRRRHKQD